ncbi:hypothetical protein TCAL_15686 [Tigriopus californicus]|uniref:DEAD-box helicase OB fold domain-containing protein n=1 Tax=Tigriopus californicus TaxID=6832 RepID=A0A553PBT6_TIGCA|nr:hypothetical protein TCAL_15686 [Tigriopus californicus]
MVLSTGLPNNMAYRDHMSHSKGVYRTMSGNNVVFIHPSSALFKRNPELVIFHETVTTSRTFMRIVSVCERSKADRAAMALDPDANGEAGGFSAAAICIICEFRIRLGVGDRSSGFKPSRSSNRPTEAAL